MNIQQKQNAPHSCVECGQSRPTGGALIKFGGWGEKMIFSIRQPIPFVIVALRVLAVKWLLAERAAGSKQNEGRTRR